jgi:hypothetical protein
MLSRWYELVYGDEDVPPRLTISDKVWRLWNSGADRGDFPDDTEYTRLLGIYGTECIPIYDVYGFHRITDERRREHYGLNRRTSHV